MFCAAPGSPLGPLGPTKPLLHLFASPPPKTPEMTWAQNPRSPERSGPHFPRGWGPGWGLEERLGAQEGHCWAVYVFSSLWEVLSKSGD